MEKAVWKPGNMLYPVPAVMVSMADRWGRSNIITVAWAGTICTNPPMLSISVRPERYSYGLLKDSGEFAVNLTTDKLLWAADWCGVKSGRDTDKFRELRLTAYPARELAYAPLIGESPVNIECRVTRIEELGSHHMFLAKVVCVQADEAYLDEQGRFDLNRAGLIAYSHGEYYRLGQKAGTFGYSVSKKDKKAAGKNRTADYRKRGHRL